VFRSLAEFGVRPEDGDDIRAAKVIWCVCMWFALPSCWIMVAVCHAFHWRTYGTFWLASGIFYAALVVLFVAIRRGIEWIGLASQIYLIVASLTFAVTQGGLLQSGGVVFMGLIGPLYALAFPKTSRATYMMVLYLIGVGLAAILQPTLHPATVLTASANLWLFVATYSVMGAFTFIALLFFVTQRTAALRRLEVEQERSERLLLNILPGEVATILKQENRVIANQYEGASVLFADVVGFTPMSAQMTAVQVVELLNEVFSHLDGLVDRYGLEKIKTIGDCYMVASGIPKPRIDHAQALVSMALDIRDLVETRVFVGERRLSFRIGINSGPVVAGVIGRKKFSYDLWGDAVNTASRMESHGVGGAIQITRSTYDLIKDDFDCLPLSPVQVKGKGEMEVWHVRGRVVR
jgi:guanylate cyclase